ncbi:unnamed protein product [Lactuca virosa]|uniref:Water stress and hypersensitive response domain-containing protein n=1 Tax=Lactuca virosa TaxID=75947 RepID=A0AAU9PD78_9ASTR|nr:unnamed protein product [Lactuca virosa]
MCGVVEMVKHLFSDTVESIEKPEARVTDVDPKGVGAHSVTYLAKVNVSNPYCIPIPLGEIRYLLKSSGREIASGTIYDTGSLKGKGDTLLYVEIDVANSVLVTLVKDIAVDWDIDYDLKVTLIIDFPLICDISIPVTRNGQIKLPSLADVLKKKK